MAQPESNLSRRIQKEIRKRGWFCFKVHGSEFMMAGLPDIVVCAEGLFIGLETKMPDKRDNVSPRQVYVRGLIQSAKGTSEVICSPAEAIAVIEEALSNR